jgi:hypothetical protein
MGLVPLRVDDCVDHPPAPKPAIDRDAGAGHRPLDDGVLPLPHPHARTLRLWRLLAAAASRYPDVLLYPDLYHWLEREHNIPILSKFSFIGAPEALQIFSVIFVTAFVGFLVYLGYLNLQRRPPPEAA